MEIFKYIDGVTTLKLDQDTCIGCGKCAEVCPHQIFTIQTRKAVITDLDACMECGACAKNCPVVALTVNPGVGCASYLMSVWFSKITGKKVGSVCC